uniref:Translocator protein n=1 Tax=Timema shepardi TaxID=629360 RepID=A0A7R9ALX3_TIMSH|nr:unnamed protein product [Timema shepardi]
MQLIGFPVAVARTMLRVRLQHSKCELRQGFDTCFAQFPKFDGPKEPLTKRVQKIFFLNTIPKCDGIKCCEDGSIPTQTEMMKINWVAIALVILPNVGGWFGIIFNRANEAWYSTRVLDLGRAKTPSVHQSGIQTPKLMVTITSKPDHLSLLSLDQLPTDGMLESLNYMTLILPSWNPPSYLFAPVWTILYCVMGFASYLIWRDGGGFKEEARIPLILYCTQLILNWIWTPIFYGAHSILWGLVDIVVLWVNIIACMFTFFRLNRIAAYLLFPYLVWISFATALNYAILMDNPDK